jgi:hypothetical protein
MILVTPELDVPLPFSLTTEEAKDLHARAQAAFNTVEFLTANGMQVPTVTPPTRKKLTLNSLSHQLPVKNLLQFSRCNFVQGDVG